MFSQSSSLFGVTIVLGLLSAYLAPPAHAQQPSSPSPTVWVMPDWEDNGDSIRQIFTHPEQWSETRKYIDVYEFSSFKYFSDDELKTWFGELDNWNIKIAVECGALKEWGTTADKVIAAETPYFRQIKNDGGNLYAIAMDEPLTAMRKVKLGDAYAAQQTASYIAQVRKLVPGVLVGDIEPYPFISATDQIAWIQSLNNQLSALGERGIDFYRIDPNWIANAIFGGGSWKDLYQVESFCKSQKIPYSMIYWSSGIAGFTKYGIDSGKGWYIGAVNQAGELALAGSHPDQYVIESWVKGAPSHSLPESDPFSFMGSVNEIATHYAKPGQ